jgi:ribosomal protein S2
MIPPNNRDPRAVKLVAKSIYRELASGGFADKDVVALASELLSLVTDDVRARKSSASA